MPTTQTAQVIKPYWMVRMTDGEHNFVAYGQTYDEVWGKVCDAENFEVQQTECHIYERMVSTPLNEGKGLTRHSYWLEREVREGEDDPALREQMMKYSFEPKEVL